MTSEEIEAFRKGQKVFVSEMYHAAIDAVCDAALRSKSERNAALEEAAKMVDLHIGSRKALAPAIRAKIAERKP